LLVAWNTRCSHKKPGTPNSGKCMLIWCYVVLFTYLFLHNDPHFPATPYSVAHTLQEPGEATLLGISGHQTVRLHPGAWYLYANDRFGHGGWGVGYWITEQPPLFFWSSVHDLGSFRPVTHCTRCVTLRNCTPFAHLFLVHLSPNVVSTLLAACSGCADLVFLTHTLVLRLTPPLPPSPTTISAVQYARAVGGHVQGLPFFCFVCIEDPCPSLSRLPFFSQASSVRSSRLVAARTGASSCLRLF
jgi:hypothetical protein